MEGGDDIVQDWVDATLQTALSLNPKSYVPKLFWSQNTRPDGRVFGQARPTTITQGILKQNTLGSSLVKFLSPARPDIEDDGLRTKATHVIAGVTAEVGQPASVQGDLKVTLVPENAALESWLQRLLVQIVDVQQLCIEAGKSAFGLDVSVVVLNQEGNAKDACLLAAVAALQDTTLPPIVVKNERVYTLQSDNELLEEGAVSASWTTYSSKPLSLAVIPLPLFIGIMKIPVPPEKESLNNQQHEHLLVDPLGEEEMVCEGFITLVVDGLNTDRILSIDYEGHVSIAPASMALASKMAQGRARELLPLLETKK